MLNLSVLNKRDIVQCHYDTIFLLAVLLLVKRCKIHETIYNE